MSTHRSPRLDRHTTEQLLGGAPATTEATRPLAALLHAAAAPAHPEELSGEWAAVAAFDGAARLEPAPRPRSLDVLRSTLARVLTVKAAVILAAAAGTTGVVLVSTTGVLNHGGGPAEHRPADHSPAVHSTAHSPTGTHNNGNNSNNDGDNNRDNAGGESSSAPNPSMLGLCNAYEAHESDNPGKALDSPAFAALVTAAGGKDQVDEYCDAIAAGKGAGGSDDPHGKPAGHPHEEDSGHGGTVGTGNPHATHPAAPPKRHHGAPAPPVIGG
jgi:hypothetical protein